MFQKKFLASYIKYGVAAAILYCITVIIFLKSADFTSTWWLFVGNALFLCAIVAHVLAFNRLRNENDSTQNLVAAGHIATVVGIILSCIITAILLFSFVPDIFSAGKSDTVLENAPAQTGSGKTNGLIFILAMNTIIGNFCGGSVASIIVPFTAIRNQMKDRKSKVLNN